MNFPGYSYNGAVENERKKMMEAYQNFEIAHSKIGSVFNSSHFYTF
jgi:hypothetical protein